DWGQMTGWTEQIAIVTGGSRGIGRAIARALAARGAAICINYATRAVEAEAAAGEIAATGGRVIAFQADVADADAVALMATRTDTGASARGVAPRSCAPNGIRNHDGRSWRRAWGR